MSPAQRKVRSREDDHYSNSTIKYGGIRKLDHITCLLQIIKAFIHPPQGSVISIC